MSTLVSLGGREVPLESLYLSEERNRLFDGSKFPNGVLELKEGSWKPFYCVFGTVLDSNRVFSIDELISAGFIPNSAK